MLISLGLASSLLSLRQLAHQGESGKNSSCAQRRAGTVIVQIKESVEGSLHSLPLHTLAQCLDTI